MMKHIRKYLSRHVSPLIWFKHTTPPDYPCKIILYNRKKGTGTSYNFNGSNWNIEEGIVWTHAPLEMGAGPDEQGVVLCGC